MDNLSVGCQSSIQIALFAENLLSGTFAVACSICGFCFCFLTHAGSSTSVDRSF